eukprot:g1320.t1
MVRSPSKASRSPSKKKAAKTKKQKQQEKKRAAAQKKKLAEQLRKKKLREKKLREMERKRKQAAAAKEKKRIQREKKRAAAQKKKKLLAERKKKQAEKDKLKELKLKKKREKASKPKRARSAYTFFVSANRSKIQMKNPNWNFKELAKAVADQWKACGPEDRAHYEELAMKDKIRSEKEREAFRSSKPKRAMSAYMFFVKENRKHIKDNHPEMSFAEVGKALGHAWKHCVKEHREKYMKLAERDKQRAEFQRAQNENLEIAGSVLMA